MYCNLYNIQGSVLGVLDGLFVSSVYHYSKSVLNKYDLHNWVIAVTNILFIWAFYQNE